MTQALAPITFESYVTDPAHRKSVEVSAGALLRYAKRSALSVSIPQSLCQKQGKDDPAWRDLDRQIAYELLSLKRQKVERRIESLWLCLYDKDEQERFDDDAGRVLVRVAFVLYESSEYAAARQAVNDCLTGDAERGRLIALERPIQDRLRSWGYLGAGAKG